MSKVKSHQSLPTNWNEREALREKGQFWTPSWVSEAMVSYVCENTNLLFDPATGRGAFYEALLKLNRPNVSYYGTDIDPEVLTDERYKNNSCLVEVRDFIKNPPAKKFNAIVGNPPYIRHHRINDDTKLFLKRLTTNFIGFAIDGRAGYHIYFLLQALKHLEKDGKLAFIMPADTCEGKFAKDLWKWITEKFCLEAVITFAENATPFPNVDTNALIFLIKNIRPSESFYWVKAKEAYSSELSELVSSHFTIKTFNTLEISNRNLQEGLQTGFSRPTQTVNSYKYHLDDFARVMRGIATGSNEFFFLTAQQIKNFNLPHSFFKRAIGRTRDAQQDVITHEDIEQLDKDNRPTYLLSLKGNDYLPKTVTDYLKVGEDLGLPNRSLIKQRNPWYKMEKRKTPPILFSYLGRRDTRFIKNEADILPLTGFLCLYPIYQDELYIVNLWKALNHPDTLENLKLVGKSYGSGAIKVEPSNLSRLPIPEHIVALFDLKRQYKAEGGQLEFFRSEKKNDCTNDSKIDISRTKPY